MNNWHSFLVSKLMCINFSYVISGKEISNTVSGMGAGIFLITVKISFQVHLTKYLHASMINN